MKIRDGTKEDVPAMLEIFNREVAQDVNAFDTVLIDDDGRDAWFAPHLDARFPMIVADDNGTIAGWASLSAWARHGAYERTAELSVYIHEAQRGRGVGKDLLQGLIGRARELGHHVLLGRTEASNQASRRLHLACGFSQVGLMREVGWKHGRYLDVAIFQLIL